MLASGRQRRARRERKRKARVRKAETRRVEPMVADIVDSVSRLADYTRATSEPAQAVARARAAVRSHCDAIIERVLGRSIVDVVVSCRVNMFVEASFAGAEISAAALEVVALVLACRGSTVPGPDVDESFMPPAIYGEARDALSAGALIPLLEADPSDPFAEVLFLSTQREVSLRNPVCPHMLVDSLRGIFDDPGVAADCQAVLGFSGCDAVSVMVALRTLAAREFRVRIERMFAAREDSAQLFRQRRLRGSRDGDGAAAPPTDEEIHAAKQVFEALEGLTTNAVEIGLIDMAAVAEEAGLSREVVQAVVDRFTLAQQSDLDEVMYGFFHGDNPLRTAPIVMDEQNRRAFVHDALALPAIREVIEHELKAAGRLSVYEKHRGKWVENAALDLLTAALPGAQSFQGFNYFIPDPDASTPQTRPEEYTKRVEGDGLLILDDVAIIVEVKSVSLTAEARGGVERRLRGKLRDIVTAATDQAERLRQRIIEDKRVRLDDDAWIDASGIREIHTIAVGLEDLSGVTTSTAMLLSAGVLKADDIPWTVSLHDLRIVCEISDRPSELLLYLRRRTHPEATLKFRAIDELDLYMHFLSRGLYVEPDPDVLAHTVNWEPTTVAARRRRAKQAAELVNTYTDPLDAWYRKFDEPDASDADKPAMVGDPSLLRLVDQIEALGARGRFAVAAILLEGSAQARERFGRHAIDLAKSTRIDGKPHTITHLLIDTSGSSFVLVWATLAPSQSVDDTRDRHLQYLAAKKHQTKAGRAALMIFDPSGDHLLDLLYDNRELGPDPELDEVAAGLFPLDTRHRIRRDTRRGNRSRPKKHQ